MDRYQHVVRFGMFGHTHDQYFSVTRSVADMNKIIGLNQVGPSGTTVTDENPAYALIDVDAETMLPINFRIFAMDLVEANASGTPQWVQMIDYVNDYGMTEGMSPDALYRLAVRLTTDKRFYEQFMWDNSRRTGKKPRYTDKKWIGGANSDYCKFTSSSDKEKEEC